MWAWQAQIRCGRWPAAVRLACADGSPAPAWPSDCSHLSGMVRSALPETRSVLLQRSLGWR